MNIADVGPVIETLLQISVRKVSGSIGNIKTSKIRTVSYQFEKIASKIHAFWRNNVQKQKKTKTVLVSVSKLETPCGNLKQLT